MPNLERPKNTFESGKKLPDSVGSYRLDKMSLSELAQVPEDVVQKLNMRAGEIGQGAHFDDFKDFRRIQYDKGELGFLAYEKAKDQHGFTKESVYLVDAMDGDVTGDIEMQYIFAKSVKRELDDPADTPFVFWSETEKKYMREGRALRRAEILHQIAKELYHGKVLHSGRLNPDDESMNKFWENLKEEGLAEIVQLKGGGKRIAFKD